MDKRVKCTIYIIRPKGDIVEKDPGQMEISVEGTGSPGTRRERILRKKPVVVAFDAKDMLRFAGGTRNGVVDSRL